MKEMIKLSIRYAIACIISSANSNPNFSQEEKETLLNNTFNGLINGLIPEYAEYALETILHYSNSYKKIENSKMFDSIGWTLDEEL